jgi:hypothetical protein
VHGPSECADTGELAFRVERSLGAPLASAAPLSFEVLVWRGASAYVARIRMTNGSSAAGAKERVLNATDCGRLADAVSVAIALALGEAGEQAPDATSRADAPETPAAPSAAAAAPAVSPAPDPSAVDDGTSDGREAEPATAWVPALSAWLIGDAGSLPEPGLGAALGAELAWGRITLRALGTLLFEQHATLGSAPAPAPGADLDLLAGSLLACTSPFAGARGELAALACLGLEIGRLAGVGTDVAEPRRGSALWAAPRIDLEALWSVPGSALRLSAALTAAAPLNRDEFALTGIGTVHQPPSIVGRLSVGVGVGFD